MSTSSRGNALVKLYSRRFGEPFTKDEVYGYWLFVAGAVLAVLGMATFLTAMGAGQAGTRLYGYVLGGAGLAAALAGLVVGQSFHRTAKWLVYLGLLVCLAAIAWFTTIFPGEWALGSAAAQNVVATYTVGLAVIALSGAIAPVVVGQSRARRAVEDALTAARADDEADDAAIADLQEQVAARDRRIDELETERDAATETAEGVQAHLATLEESTATFDVYRDASGKWRWRLVHRNGNIIATSGESYASDRNARRGMRSVQRNALGAANVWQRDEEEPEPEPAPVADDSKATFELYEDVDGEWRWRLRHDNGNVIAAATRGFSSKAAAADGVEAVRGYVGPADYLEFDPAGVEVYEDAAGEYRWRLVHRNGRILADSGEGYASRSNARRAADRLQELAGEATVGADDGDRYELYEDAGGEYRWRLVAANGEPVADSGEGYTERSEAEDAVERVREYAPAADTLTLGPAAVELYEDADGEYRWRLRHRNGTILGTAGEGYADRSGAIEAVNGVKRNAPGAATEDVQAEQAD